MNWLFNALKEKNNFKGEIDSYDILMRKELIYKRDIRNVRAQKDSLLQGKELVAWGFGDCFRRNYDRIKSIYPLKYVCDNNQLKWGDTDIDGITCISPGQLREMKDVFVIIMVDSGCIAVSIANMLLDMGIRYFEHVENWLIENE